MRFRLKTIVKVSTVLLVIYFITVLFKLPFFDSGEEYQQKLHEHARNRNFQVPDVLKLDEDSDHHGNALPVIAQPQLKLPVFKKNILGNFEVPVEIPKTGPGEGGVPFHVPPEKHAEEEAGKKQYGFDIVASNIISLDRAPKDLRNDECKYWHYPEALPTVSVVIVFINEGLSILLRTVHSVINQSPKHLLVQIVLVDDKSNKADLGKELDDHAAQFGDLIKIVRNEKREGLIRARNIGALNADRGDVVVFLDAHCEAQPNWLVPLIAPIAADRRALTVPLVDVINAATFEIVPQSVYNAQGAWDWNFNYKRIPVPAPEKKKHSYETEPYASPAMAGGLFAIERNYFMELGLYDPGLEFWGAEQYELSFKVWQCHGQVLFVPCSRVGHIYRPHVPGYVGNPIPGTGIKGVSYVDLNNIRVAEVWMDEYKDYFYRSYPHLVGQDGGDLTKQKKVRDDLQCKSFKWFMDNVAYGVVERYPLSAANIAWGEVQNIGSSSRICLDRMGRGYGQPVGASGCHHWGGSQLYRLTDKKELLYNEHCISVNGDKPVTVFCHDSHSHMVWEYNDENKWIYDSAHDKCMQLEPNNSDVVLAPCDTSNKNQKWSFLPSTKG